MYYCFTIERKKLEAQEGEQLSRPLTQLKVLSGSQTYVCSTPKLMVFLLGQAASQRIRLKSGSANNTIKNMTIKAKENTLAKSGKRT